MVKVGDKVPSATLRTIGPEGPKAITTEELFAPGKKVVAFALPGAFTPTCSAKHVPGYVQHLDELKQKGVDEVWCLAVNDGFVMAAWGRELGAFGKIRMLGDGSAELAKKLGLDTEIAGMGTRSRRFSLLIDQGIVQRVNVEEPGKFLVSNAETMLEQLG